MAILERVASRGDSPDCIFAGAARACLYTRSRWGDAQCKKSALRLDTIELEDKSTAGYLEFDVEKTKTSNRRGVRDLRITLDGPASGFSPDFNWAVEACERRDEEGLSALKPLMLIPGADGSWLGNHLTSADASVWLPRS